MRYASIREMDISNGEGIGVALFVQGCHFHCKGCFNQSTWDFNGGYDWTYETLKYFLSLANKPYISRVSILGGEPLADENVQEVCNIISWIRELFPTKKIWLYTGYTFDEIFSMPPDFFPILENRYKNYKLLFNSNEFRKYAIVNSDILLDGKFEIEKQDINSKTKQWVGSTNQRVLNIQNMIKLE